MDIIGAVPRFEAGDTRLFTLTFSNAIPQTVSFVVYAINGAVSSLPSFQANEVVVQTPSGFYNFTRTLPDTRGFYTYKWTGWDAASRTYKMTGEFEIVQTEAYSIFTYANVPDVIRTAREMFGRSELTFHDLASYFQAADGMIDAYLSGLVTTPIVTPPAIIQDASKVYTLWRFYCDYGKQKDSEPPPIIHRKEEYDDFFESVAAGSSSIPGISVDNNPYQVTLISETGYKPVFDMRNMEEQHVSSSLIEDLRNEDDED